jgi:hypothetical protein
MDPHKKRILPGISLHDLLATVHSLLKFRFLSVVERTQHAMIDRYGVASRTRDTGCGGHHCGVFVIASDQAPAVGVRCEVIDIIHSSGISV